MKKNNQKGARTKRPRYKGILTISRGGKFYGEKKEKVMDFHWGRDNK